MNVPPARLAFGRVGDLSGAAEARVTPWLSAAEQARLARLKVPGRRLQFISGRWLARQTLAAALGGDPLAWALSAPEDGPPAILRHPVPLHGRLHLGLSHSGDHVMCAVSAQPLGIDLESPRRERDVATMAHMICTPDERLRLRLDNGAIAPADFYDLWTLKEAWIKRCAGSVSPGRMSRVHTHHAEAGRSANARLWRCEGFTAAVVGDGLDALHVTGLPEGCGEPDAWTVEEALPSC